jgi:hypothetical protein
MIGVDGMTRIVGYAPLGATPEGLRVAVGLSRLHLVDQR